MSRIGNRILAVPAGVTVTSQSDNWIEIRGPLGTNRLQFAPQLKISLNDRQLKVVRPHDSKRLKQLHGTTNALLQSMLVGVKTGFCRRLLVSGVGYRAAIDGQNLKLSLGFSQPVSYMVPKGITVDVLKGGVITVQGVNKQQVGQVAAIIRHFRPVEPYNGKGISYQGEKVRRKAGKTAGK